MPPRSLQSASVDELRRAVLWREVAAERMSAALALLREAEAGMPVSLERVVLRKAIKLVQDAVSKAQDDAAVGRRAIEDRSDPATLG